MNVPISSTASSSSLATDSRSIDALRSSAARDPKAAIKEAAKQFEALFMQQLMKSMREATMSSGMLENSGTQMGTEMLDVQFATKMTGLPGGLSDVIARQLERQMGGAAAAPTAGPELPAAMPTVSPAATPASGTGAGDMNVTQQQLDFMRAHRSSAQAVQAQSGIPAAFMVGQAAHETGWGQKEIRNADGSASHNLFGIKAGSGWSGPVAEVTTTEYTNGEARKVTAKFRAYGSYEESFRDYARLIKDSPRYAGVMAQAQAASSGATASVQGSAQGFAQGLQRAGYATDPAYADKLARVINKTLHWQRVMT